MEDEEAQKHALPGALFWNASVAVFSGHLLAPVLFLFECLLPIQVERRIWMRKDIYIYIGREVGIG